MEGENPGHQFVHRHGLDGWAQQGARAVAIVGGHGHVGVAIAGRRVGVGGGWRRPGRWDVRRGLAVEADRVKARLQVNDTATQFLVFRIIYVRILSALVCSSELPSSPPLDIYRSVTFISICIYILTRKHTYAYTYTIYT